MEVENNKNDYYWKLLQRQVQEQRIERVFDIFRRNNFEPILIKGWAAARNYPKPFERLSIDIDIAVSPDDYLECQKILQQQPIAGVDLHRGLRHLDTVAWDNLTAHSQLLKLNKTKVRILCQEDHLRILCVHWLTDGGVAKERLWDIVYAVQNRAKDFDWNRCLNIVSETRREWINCTVRLAVKYLGLNIDNTPFAKMAENLPGWVVKTIEKEWESKVRLKPLQNCLGDSLEFFEQISKRIPPNPIQATIEMEGKFDEKTRIFYQIGSFLFRFIPSIKRISKTLWRDRINKYHKTASIGKK
jgi:hypothetical protein